MKPRPFLTRLWETHVKGINPKTLKKEEATSSHRGSLPANIDIVLGTNFQTPLYRSALPRLEHARGLVLLGVERVLSCGGFSPDEHKQFSDAMGDSFIAFDKDREDLTLEYSYISEGEVDFDWVDDQVSFLESQDVSTLVHCGSGANRSGIVIAALKVKQGALAKDAYLEMFRYFHIPIKRVRHYFSILKQMEKKYHS